MPRIDAATVKEHRDAQHRAVLDAAGAILAEGGYDALTLGAVGRRIGLARTSVYRYAVDRDELLAQWLDRLFQPAAARIIAILNAPGSPADRLADWGDAALAFASSARNPAAARLIAEFDRLPATTQTAIVAGHRTIRAALAATVREALADQPGRDPDIAAALIQTLVTAAIRQAAHAPPPTLHAETRHAIAAILTPLHDPAPTRS